MDRFSLNARVTERRGRFVVYIKAAEKIADFLRIIEANQAVMKFENIRISRDFTNSITRLNNMDVANEMKTQAAARNQLEDIEILSAAGKVEKLDEKLKDVVVLRQEFPEASLNELAGIYEKRTGTTVSKSGMKHRFVRIHELAEKERGRENDR
jgi:DNA-binding protein WhiA